MKLAALSIWMVAALILGFAGAAGWPLVAGLFLLPVFYIGKPWYSSITEKIAERK
ncbi:MULTISPECIES: hypothetical protein [unclassified Planococcus (in: firmicutes)]|uniref:hypothetical protein n=1 Tax=unclassified Planococcus (in: firmicutes) TaxID=2662419 RepID=UPI0012FF3F5F|nr:MULTISPECIES: hypothetical protein [unclassified Planococcus (in: firmicutes)]